jgi:hypothetical protein
LGYPRKRKKESSFLKKRSKRLLFLCTRCTEGDAAGNKVFLVLFFQKKNILVFLRPPTGLCQGARNRAKVSVREG